MSKINKLWRISAYTSADKKYRFASCDVVASTREDAIEKALNKDIISDPALWTAGAGHIMTASAYRKKEK